MRVYPEHIRLDGGTQPRAALQQDVIQEYRELMVAGVKFPPLTVFHDGEAYWLADGYHRLGALLRINPSEPIECDVRQGTCADAQWYSYSANQTHGLRRSNDDKRRAVQAALAHPNAAVMSDNQLAEHCGVSQPFVSKLRREAGATYNGFKSFRQTGQTGKSSTHSSTPTSKNGKSSGQTAEDSESRCEPTAPKAQPPEPAVQSPENHRPNLRKGRDGRTINTARIGRTQSRKAMRPRSSTEFTQARREGYRGRPGSMVKLEIPNNNVQNCAFDLLEYFTFEYLEKVFQAIVSLHTQRKEKESNV